MLLKVVLAQSLLDTRPLCQHHFDSQSILLVSLFDIQPPQIMVDNPWLS